MYYSIDGKLVSEKNIQSNKITENFINIPFFQFTSATNAGLKSTKDIESENNAKIKNDIFVDNDANIKGNIVLDGNIIKDEVEINLDNYWIPSNNGKNINFNGNVGIGNNKPSCSLEVNGPVKFNSSNDNYRSLILNSTSTDGNAKDSNLVFQQNGVDKWDFYYQTSSSMLHFNTKMSGGAGKVLSLNSNGYVGIGNGNPSAKIHIIDNKKEFLFNQGNLMLRDNNYMSNYGCGNSRPVPDGYVGDYGTSITFHRGGNSGEMRVPNSEIRGVSYGCTQGYGGYAGGISFFTQVGNKSSERMRIDPKGNVGIGKNNPKKNLDINGGILTTPILYSGNADRAYLIVGCGYYNESNQGWTGEKTNWGTYGFQHKIKSDSRGIPRITIDSSIGEAYCITQHNKIGIGTSDPKQRLDVNGAIRIQQTDKKHKGEGGEIQLAFGDQSKGYRHWHIDVEANNRFRIFKNDAGKVVSGIDITEEGNMSIGKSKADRKLEVAGSFSANSINPFPGNDSGTYYSRWNFYAKKRLTHFICAFQVDHKNIQTTMEIDFSMVYTRSKNGTHNRNQRSAGKLIFNMVSTSPSNQENAGRSDGNWYVRYSCDNSNYVVDGQMGTGPGFYFLRKNDSCYLVAAIGQSRSDGGTYTGMFKVNIMDPFLQGFHMFTDNETKKAEANVEPHECHKYDPNNQRPDNYKEDNFPGEYKFVDKDYHTWMKIGDDTTGSASFKQKYNEKKYDQEIKSPN